MANKSRFIIAESSIKAFFSKGPQKVFSKEDIRRIFEERRGLWNLPISYSLDKFIEQLVKREVLKNEQINFAGHYGMKERYVAGDQSIFKFATSLQPKSYLSHHSAVFLHGLTNQVPKNIYITFEQAKKRHIDRELEQDAIDGAFAHPQRKASSKAIRDGYTLIMLNGMFTNRLGVTTIDDIPVTNLERTLIDITVRPNYAGGVDAVLETYRNALPLLSMNKLIATLESLNYIYPYHQAIGFYLEKAGYEGKKLEELRNKAMEFDFYLTYEMKEKKYSKQWKLYYPKEM